MVSEDLKAKLQDRAWRDACIKPVKESNPDWIESEEVRGEDGQ